MVSEADRELKILSEANDIHENTESTLTSELDVPELDTNDSLISRPRDNHIYGSNDEMRSRTIDDEMALHTHSNMTSCGVPLVEVAKRLKPTAIVHPMRREDRPQDSLTSSRLVAQTETVSTLGTLIPPPTMRLPSIRLSTRSVDVGRSIGVDGGSEWSPGVVVEAGSDVSGPALNFNFNADLENSSESCGANDMSGSDAELSPTLSICRLTGGGGTQSPFLGVHPSFEMGRSVGERRRDGERTVAAVAGQDGSMSVSCCESSQTMVVNEKDSSNDSGIERFEEQEEEQERGEEEELRRKLEKATLMTSCSFYYGSMTNAEAKAKLKRCEIGSYLLRDSSDNKFLYSISVKTSRGTTSIRVAPTPGCSSCANCLTPATSSWAVPTNCDDTAASPYFISDAFYRPRTPPSPATPSYLNVKSSSQFRTSYPTRRMMRLDCDPSQESQMPHFPDVLSLINYCVRLGHDETMRNKCMFLERSGRMDTPILLKKSVTK